MDHLPRPGIYRQVILLGASRVSGWREQCDPKKHQRSRLFNMTLVAQTDWQELICRESLLSLHSHVSRQG